MSDVGDVVFCRLQEPNWTEFGYWVVKEVSAVSENGAITHVCPLGHPEAESKISIFVECGVPQRKPGKAFKDALREEVQINAAGRLPDRYVDPFFEMFQVKIRPTSLPIFD